MSKKKSLAELKEELIDLREERERHSAEPTTNAYINLLIRYYAVARRIKAIEAGVLVCLMLLISGCNTGVGIGKDIQQINQGVLDQHANR